jgi:hypothetical protein
MDAVSPFREGLLWAHELLEMIMADVTPEQAHWTPPGIANPLGAIYVHALCAEDGVVNGMLKGSVPLFAGEWSGRCGVEQPQPALDLAWARSLRVDLPAFRQYAQAVYLASEAFLGSLTAGGLAREIDLSRQGLGRRPVSWCLNALVIAHVNNMAGEISVLKGLQGVKGYPF